MRGSSKLSLASKILRLLPKKIQWGLQNSRAKLRARIIGQYASGVLTHSYNGDIIVPVYDFVVGKKLAYEGKYDRETLEFHFNNTINSESNVLVVGAHVGALIIPIAKKVKSAVGIEANPDTFKFLKLNLRLNKIENTKIYNYAAGNKNGEIDFLKNTVNSGGSKILSGRANLDIEFTYDNPEIISVPMKILDDEFQGIKFDLIIMDIEGSEYFALNGMKKLLKSTRFLQLEINPNHITKIAQISGREFIEILRDNFIKAVVLENISNSSYTEFSNERFAEMINYIFTVGPRDVLFSKA